MTALIGAAPTATISASDTNTGKMFALGDRRSYGGEEWIFVQANGAITGAGYVCQISEAYQAAMVSTTGDAIGDLIGVAGVAFADDDYGWLQIAGPCVVRVAASAAANVRLNTTSTAGQLDDDGSASSMAIDGLVLTTANGGAAATAAAILSYPRIISVGESAFTDGVTPGTATANKALVLGASKEIATITSAAITTLTSDAIAGGDASLGITGQAAAAGGDVAVAGGASASGDNNGGNVILTGGAANGSGVAGMIIKRSVELSAQGAPTAKTVSATLTAAEILAGIITVNQAAAGASELTLPLAADMDTGLPDAAAGDAFDFSVINTSTVDAEDATVLTNTGWTLVGAMDVPAYNAAGSLNSSGRFRARKTGAGAWTLYRLS